jgi:hypothetical protein
MSFTHPQGSRAPAGEDARYRRTVGVLGGTVAASWLHLQLPPSAAPNNKSASLGSKWKKRKK